MFCSSLPRMSGLVLLLWAAGCGGENGPGPSRPPLTVTMPDPVEGRYVSCTTCPEPSVTVILEFAVTIADPNGDGGTLDRLETVVINATRGEQIVRNVRPNASYSFANRTIARGGSLTVEAAAGFAPPPPRDDVRVTVHAHLTDGRSGTSTAPLAVPPAGS
jgi:hypothetical protein